MSPDLLSLFDPQPDALIDLLRARIDDSMLVEIAAADVPFQVDANLRVLIPIRQTGKIPAPLEWEPKEVLELTRWDEPDNQPEGSGYDRMRGHTIRAFACAILLRAGGDPKNSGRFCGENDTLAKLLMSILMLADDELLRTTAQLVAWRIEPENAAGQDDDMPAFFELALLWLASFRAGPRFDEAVLVRLAEGVVETERILRERLAYHIPDATRWLLGLTYYDQSHDVWKTLARQVREEASRLASDDARACVLDISGRLLGRDA